MCLGKIFQHLHTKESDAILNAICLDYEQVAMPMVHPITGETISSYKRLMKDPTTAKAWQMAFGKNLVEWHRALKKQGKKGQTPFL
jgi:hypothetical protein